MISSHFFHGSDPGSKLQSFVDNFGRTRLLLSNYTDISVLEWRPTSIRFRPLQLKSSFPKCTITAFQAFRQTGSTNPAIIIAVLKTAPTTDCSHLSSATSLLEVYSIETIDLECDSFADEHSSIHTTQCPLPFRPLDILHVPLPSGMQQCGCRGSGTLAGFSGVLIVCGSHGNIRVFVPHVLAKLIANQNGNQRKMHPSPLATLPCEPKNPSKRLVNSSRDRQAGINLSAVLAATALVAVSASANAEVAVSSLGTILTSVNQQRQYVEVEIRSSDADVPTGLVMSVDNRWVWGLPQKVETHQCGSDDPHQQSTSPIPTQDENVPASSQYEAFGGHCMNSSPQNAKLAFAALLHAIDSANESTQLGSGIICSDVWIGMHSHDKSPSDKDDVSVCYHCVLALGCEDGTFILCYGSSSQSASHLASSGSIVHCAQMLGPITSVQFIEYSDPVKRTFSAANDTKDATGADNHAFSPLTRHVKLVVAAAVGSVHVLHVCTTDPGRPPRPLGCGEPDSLASCFCAASKVLSIGDTSDTMLPLHLNQNSVSDQTHDRSKNAAAALHPPPIDAVTCLLVTSGETSIPLPSGTPEREGNTQQNSTASVLQHGNPAEAIQSHLNGQFQIWVGTYSNQLLRFTCSTQQHSIASKFGGYDTAVICQSCRLLPDPVCCIIAGDFDGDGVAELAVCSTQGVHLLQVESSILRQTIAQTVKKAFSILEEIHT